MREPAMLEPMIKLLQEKGYSIISENRGRRRGPDLIAAKDGKKLIMEMKGDSAALGVDFGTGIFQLFRHIEPDSSDEYALGISQAYVRYAREAEFPLQKLGIKVFVVNRKSYQLW